VFEHVVVPHTHAAQDLALARRASEVTPGRTISRIASAHIGLEPLAHGRDDIPATKGAAE